MPGQQRALLVGLLVVVTAVAFESMAVTTAMPAAAADLGQVELYAWAFTATVLPMIVAIVLAGRLADHHGPVRPLVGGLVVLVAGTVVAASAPTMPVLLAGRLLQGFGGGAVNLALMVVTALAFTPAQRAATITWYSAAWMLPSFVGPGVAAWLSEQFSWHWVFWSVLPFMVLGGLVVVPRLRDLPPPDPDAASKAPVWAAVAVAGGTALVQVAGQALALWSVAAAVGGFVLVGLGGPRLMPAGHGPFDRGLPAVIGVRGLASGAFFGVQAFLPLALVRQHEVSLLLAGIGITLSSTGWMLGSWLQSRPWLRVRRDRIITGGALLVTLGTTVLAAAAASGVGWIVLPIVGATISGAGMGLQSASTALAVMQLSAQVELGRNTSALQVGEMLGNALFVGLAGTVFAALTDASPATTFGALAGVLAVTAVASVLVSLRIGPVANEAVTVAKP